MSASNNSEYAKLKRNEICKNAMNRHETENDKKIILNVLCNVVQLNYAITDLLLFYKLKEFMHRSRWFFLNFTK